jgi:hypothetical protein
MSSPSERPRIAELRLDLANRLSRLSAPDPALLEDLKRQPLETLVVAYVHAAIRTVAKRPRRVIVKDPEDIHWTSIAEKAAPLLRQVETGGDVVGYICFSPHLNDLPVPGYAEWPNKDQLLGVLGYHVFQCEPRDQQRTGNHVLAFVDRTTFTVIGAFHGNAVSANGPERERLWNLVKAHGAAPVNRHYLVQMARERTQKIIELEPKLDDPEFVRKLYAETGNVMPPTPKFRWHMPYMDFGFLETTGPRFFMIWPGPN